MPLGSPSGDGRYCRAILLTLILLVPCSAAAGELYRWVDDDGNVHYSDAPPADATSGRHSRGRDDGTAREEVDPSARDDGASPEDAAADEARSEQKRGDRVLLQTYGSVDEIKRARERHLEGIDGEIGLAEHRVQRVRRKLDQYDRLLAELPADNENRAEMERQRRRALQRLEDRRAELEALRAKRERVKARFTRDIARFRELQADNGS